LRENAAAIPELAAAPGNSGSRPLRLHDSFGHNTASDLRETRDGHQAQGKFYGLGITVREDCLDLPGRIGVLQQFVGDRAHHPVAPRAPGQQWGWREDDEQR